MPIIRKLLGFMALAPLALVVGLLLHPPASWVAETGAANGRTIRPETGKMWMFSLHSLHHGDETENTTSRLFERTQTGPDRFLSPLCRFLGPEVPAALAGTCNYAWRELGPAHAAHNDVRNIGGGQYSLWQGSLLFSTSDASSPLENGRTYVLYVYSSGIEFALFLVGLLSLWGSLRLCGISMPAALRPQRTAILLFLVLAGSLATSLATAPEGTAVALRFGAVLVFLAALLPRPSARHLGSGIMLLGVGFALTIFVAGQLLDRSDWMYKAPLNSLLKNISTRAATPPTLLIIGSSYTDMGFDIPLLEAELTKQGHPVQVARISLGGMSHFERNWLLRQYLARTQNPPTYVLLEVSAYYDRQPLRQLLDNLYTDRTLRMMDWHNLPLALWATRVNVNLTQPERIQAALDIAHHFLINITLTGYLANLERYSLLLPYQLPSDPKRDDRTAEQVKADLATSLSLLQTTLQAPPQPHTPSAWASRYYSDTMALLQAHGVKHFAFFGLPLENRERIRYLGEFCASMIKAHPCITPNDKALYAALGEPRFWYNRDHVYGDGQAILTPWFASQLVKSGVLQ